MLFCTSMYCVCDSVYDFCTYEFKFACVECASCFYLREGHVDKIESALQPT